MDGKKDPGKFTVRFNIEDPRQREAAEYLNRQGRFKAQFLANAVLHYVHSPQTAGVQSATAMDSEQLRNMVEDILSRRQESSPPREPAGSNVGRQLDDTDRGAIFRTLDAFQQQ